MPERQTGLDRIAALGCAGAVFASAFVLGAVIYALFRLLNSIL